MSDFHNRSQTSARRSDYVWQYEYYDDEEPVSFEGLKAHRCKLDTVCVCVCVCVCACVRVRVRVRVISVCSEQSGLLTFTSVN